MRPTGFRRLLPRRLRPGIRNPTTKAPLDGTHCREPRREASDRWSPVGFPAGASIEGYLREVEKSTVASGPGWPAAKAGCPGVDLETASRWPNLPTQLQFDPPGASLKGAEPAGSPVAMHYPETMKHGSAASHAHRSLHETCLFVSPQRNRAQFSRSTSQRGGARQTRSIRAVFQQHNDDERTSYRVGQLHPDFSAS